MSTPIQRAQREELLALLTLFGATHPLSRNYNGEELLQLDIDDPSSQVTTIHFYLRVRSCRVVVRSTPWTITNRLGRAVMSTQRAASLVRALMGRPDETLEVLIQFRLVKKV